ncbi:hypothetical protein ACFQ9X_32090 [Catenulispora yoronensis]
MTAETAKVSALLLEGVSKILPALEGVDEAVIQAQSLLIVKNGKSLAVFNLNAAQQFQLARRPDLLGAPKQILVVLGLGSDQDRSSLGLVAPTGIGAEFEGPVNNGR